MEELRGHHGTWRLDEERIGVLFGTGRKVPSLYRALGHCSVPLAAVAAVDFDRGDRKRGWRLKLRLHEGMDPYGRLGAPGRETLTPLLLTGPHDQELLAEYFADQIAASARLTRETEGRPDPVEVAQGLVASLPLQARTGEGSVAFDGSRVRLQWDGWFASTVKSQEKTREYQLSEIEEAKWYPQVDVTEGYLRIVLRGVTIPEATELSNDFFTLVTHGTKGSEETLLLAATVNAHLQRTGRPQEPAAPPEPGGDSGEAIFTKIRELGRLHDEGLITEEEFSAKKAELLARL